MSTISALTPNTAAETTSRMTSKATTIRNEHYQETFQKFKAMGIRTATLQAHLKEKNIALPTNSKGEEICLAWHVVGMCNTNCNQHATHIKQSKADDAALLSWCETNYTLSA